ncbi:hypothetical protein RIR_jg16750.t1 [Rhizophagus irregularis DAOM 181602=DAOM 197198]|nr:hypothetical protein RIR_jg16750.t1 [Rhizophagus irregularis DAOM 181602=DAOM 197198]
MSFFFGFVYFEISFFIFQRNERFKWGASKWQTSNGSNTLWILDFGSLRLLYRTGMLRPKRGICYWTWKNPVTGLLGIWKNPITGLLGIWENLDLVGTPDKITNWTLDER